jgi:hypothetical protein
VLGAGSSSGCERLAHPPAKLLQTIGVSVLLHRSRSPAHRGHSPFQGLGPVPHQHGIDARSHSALPEFQDDKLDIWRTVAAARLTTDRWRPWSTTLDLRRAHARHLTLSPSSVVLRSSAPCRIHCAHACRGVCAGCCRGCASSTPLSACGVSGLHASTDGIEACVTGSGALDNALFRVSSPSVSPWRVYT